MGLRLGDDNCYIEFSKGRIEGFKLIERGSKHTTYNGFTITDTVCVAHIYRIFSNLKPVSADDVAMMSFIIQDDDGYDVTIYITKQLAPFYAYRITMNDVSILVEFQKVEKIVEALVGGYK